MLARVRQTGYFRPDEVDLVEHLYRTEGPRPGGRWDVLAHAHMELPEWFVPGLDPLGDDYFEQQMRLWRLVAGVERPYEPEQDEQEAPLGEIDAVRRPGYYLRRDEAAVVAASDHVIAGGMILKHGGLKPGDHALEYGAGFGQTALALARLGVNVDTVDISATFCRYVQAQADFFQVTLRAHKGQFGMNPRPGQRYDLVWFYEAFHHCLDFRGLMRSLPQLLAPNGRVLLAGEPIAEREYAAVPYPWGVRLHSEVVAIVRRFHWFELGFSEDFLYQLFTNAGFSLECVPCPPSLFGRLYIGHWRPRELEIARLWLPTALESGWQSPEGEGRWTRSQSELALDSHAPEIEVELANPLGGQARVTLELGDRRYPLVLAPGGSTRVRCTVGGARRIVFRTSSPSIGRRLRAMVRGDERYLGVLVRRLRYIEPQTGQQPPP